MRNHELLNFDSIEIKTELVKILLDERQKGYDEGFNIGLEIGFYCSQEGLSLKEAIEIGHKEGFL